MRTLLLFLLLSSPILMSQNEPIDTFFIEDLFKNGWRHTMSGYSYRMCDGKRCEGSIVDTFDNGQVRHVGFYIDGDLDGEVVDYYENGRIERIGTYEKGRKCGTYQYYYESGQLCYETYRPKDWRMEEAQKSVEYFEDGNIECKEEYSGDYKLLYSYYFNENRDTSSINRPLDFDKQIYEYVDFHDNGKRKSVEIRQYIEGEGWKNTGSWLFFDENGKLEKVIDY